MSPSIGSLTSGGIYTPPSTEASPTSTTITATSTEDSAVAAQMTVVILPNGTMRLASGQAVYPGMGNYTDSSGNVWFAGPLTGGDGSGDATESQFGYNADLNWPSITDILLYEVPIFAVNDLRFDFIVPNGGYAITAKFANANTGGDLGNFVIETQGNALSTPTDVYANVGVNHPWDYTTTATVTNNELSFVLRAVNTVGGLAPFVSALQITPVSGAGPTQPLAPATDLKLIEVK